ncbi:hypothetical protein D9757_015334 [Collybiopsis confluens]|uniref:Uncharacterized protein n=1 Tax=Collybiopsis confluens TaxID=2823264 RepID=A0A8H5CAW9_9AGAR|nr:hypothetical protein D9757_015402 [Collybiopsis confluens]KAF5340464.1 hypothetical protein D9757_015334 [Collybiopsis confluens]
MLSIPVNGAVDASAAHVSFQILPGAKPVSKAWLQSFEDFKTLEWIINTGKDSLWILGDAMVIMSPSPLSNVAQNAKPGSRQTQNSLRAAAALSSSPPSRIYPPQTLSRSSDISDPPGTGVETPKASSSQSSLSSLASVPSNPRPSHSSKGPNKLHPPVDSDSDSDSGCTPMSSSTQLTAYTAGTLKSPPIVLASRLSLSEWDSVCNQMFRYLDHKEITDDKKVKMNFLAAFTHPRLQMWIESNSEDLLLLELLVPENKAICPFLNAICVEVVGRDWAAEQLRIIFATKQWHFDNSSFTDYSTAIKAMNRRLEGTP